MLKLASAIPEDRTQLWEMLQKYLCELSQYCDIATDHHGGYVYRYFDAYFTEPERKALFIMNDLTPIGFAMVNPHSLTGQATDHVMAEFYILPEYRRNSLGLEAAEHILSNLSGRWEIKYSIRNTAAKAFWSKVTALYNPSSHPCGESETILRFSSKEES